MDFRDEIRGYAERTSVPDELTPEKLKIKMPVPVETTENTESKSDDGDVKLDAATFLRVVQTQKLTGKEFLQILGNSKIDNAAFVKIESNPNLTFQMLTEILENSALGPDDYANLLKAINKRVKAKEDALTKLGNVKTVVPKETQKTVSMPSVQPFSPTVNDKPESIDEEKLPVKNETLSEQEEVSRDESDSDYDDETEERYYGEEVDGKKKRNKGLFVSLYIVAILLIALSFGLRYYFTGSFLLNDNQDEEEIPIETNEQIFELISPLATADKAAVLSDATYAVNGQTVNGNGLLQIASDGNLLVYCSDNTLYTVKTVGGQMKLLDKREYEDKLLGVILINGRFAVVSEKNNVTIPFSYKKAVTETLEDGTETTTYVTLSDTVVKNYTVVEYLDEEVPSASTEKYQQSGTLISIFSDGKNLYLLTSDSAAENAVSDVYETYMPHYILGSEKTYANVSDVFIPKNAKNKGYVVIGCTNVGENITPKLYVCAGGNDQVVFPSEKSVLIGQNADKSSVFAKYELGDAGCSYIGFFEAEGNVTSASGIDIRDGLTRVTTQQNDSVTLTVFDGDYAVLAQTKSLGEGEKFLRTCFDTTSVYVMTEGEDGTKLYGVDTADTEDMTLLTATGVDINTDVYRFWDDNRAIGLRVLADEGGTRRGINIVMVDTSNGYKTLSEYTVTAESTVEGDWNKYLMSPAEDNILLISGDKNNGLFVVPIVYFDGVSEIEKYLVLTYNDDDGITYTGNVVEYDLRSDSQLCSVFGNFVFTVFRGKVISVNKSTMLVIDELQLNAPTEPESDTGEEDSEETAAEELPE